MRSFGVVGLLSLVAQACGKVPVSKLANKQIVGGPRAWQQNPGNVWGTPTRQRPGTQPVLTRSASVPVPQSTPQSLGSKGQASAAEAAIAAIANMNKAKQLGTLEDVASSYGLLQFVSVAAMYLVPGLAFQMGFNPEEVQIVLPAAAILAAAGTGVVTSNKNGAFDESIKAIQSAIKALDQKADGPSIHAAEVKAAVKDSLAQLGLKMPASPQYRDPQAAVGDAKAALQELEDTYASSRLAAYAFPQKLFPALAKTVIAILDAAEATEASEKKIKVAETSQKYLRSISLVQSSTNFVSISVVAVAGLVVSVVLFAVLHSRQTKLKTGKGSFLLE